MENINFIDSGEYLKRVEDNGVEITESELQESLARLEKPLGVVEYKESGSVSIEIEGLQMNFSYSPLDNKLKSELVSYTQHSLEIHDPLADPARWRVLDTIDFVADGSRVDLLGVVPNNYKILFCPTDSDFHGSVFSSESVNNIYILGDIATPRSIMTLLHEIGHVFDQKNLNEKGVDKLTTDHRHSDKAEKLRRERTASAFAFKAMKPYMNRLDLKKDSINFLKHYALASYYESTKKEMQYDEHMDRWAMSEYGDDYGQISDSEQRIYDFQEWKKTEAFKKWRATDEFKNLPDDFAEEYIAWSNWVDKTNYDYSKEI